ncbi:MAG: PilZ domain-containing protein [Nitrospinae bacterium]|nr:PilZ domain-containing protein [Nitrospinota bacterium]
MGEKDAGADKRTFFRFDYQAPVRYKFAKRTGEGQYQVSPWFKGVGANFSGGGAALHIGKPLPAKTLLLLEIKFPFSDEPVVATAEVVRREDDTINGKPVSLIMIRYLVIDEAVQDKMVSFIISRGKTVV